jgi:hypothetical protein
MSRLAHVFAIAVFAVFGAACGTDFTLPPAQVANMVDTVTLHALDGSAITLPSAYNLLFAEPIRTDRSVDFDFAVNVIDDSVLLFPTGALDFQDLSGWLRVDLAFDEVLIAPDVAYVTEEPAALQVGDVLVLRSRVISCFGAFLPVYGKMEVLDASVANRLVTFQLLLDRNCGYRGLEPGTPTQ